MVLSVIVATLVMGMHTCIVFGILLGFSLMPFDKIDYDVDWCHNSISILFHYKYNKISLYPKIKVYERKCDPESREGEDQRVAQSTVPIHQPFEGKIKNMLIRILYTFIQEVYE
jgi:hypothetical protein